MTPLILVGHSDLTSAALQSNGDNEAGQAYLLSAKVLNKYINGREFTEISLMQRIPHILLEL